MSLSHQRQVFNNIGKRGYMDRFTLDQFLARQAVKLIEESAELFLSLSWPNCVQFTRLRELVLVTKEMARAVFDDKTLWQDVRLNGRLPDTIGEAVDCQVVLCAIAETYQETSRGKIELMPAAVRKSANDIGRGVR